MKKYICTICKYEYDPAQGDPTQGIAPGTPFEALPADWKCPRCKQGKEKFVPVEEVKANPYAGTQTEKNLHAALAGETAFGGQFFRPHAPRAGFPLDRRDRRLARRFPRLRRKPARRPHPRISPLRRRHERVVRVGLWPHERNEERRLAEVVRGARPVRPRGGRAGCAVARAGGVRGRHIRPRI